MDIIQNRLDMTEKKKIQTRKRKSYKKECEKLSTELKNIQDRYLRTVAEFDNYKKRTEKEFTAYSVNANFNLLQKLLPVLDDVDRCLNIKKDDGFGALYKGIELMRKNFLNILKQEGVEEMQTVGTAFDHDKHEALMQIEAENVGPDTVLEEHAKGYMFNDRVLRYAKVIVSK